MAYDPQPFVATQVGDAGDAPSGARPIALYGAGSGEGEAGPVTWASVTEKPSTFAPAAHTHTFDDMPSVDDEVNRLSSGLYTVESTLYNLIDVINVALDLDIENPGGGPVT